MNGITDSTDMNLSKVPELVMDGEAWPAAVHGGHKELDTTEQLNNSNKRKIKYENNILANIECQ